MKAVILACERAPKLEPFTSTRPRCLVPVLNVPALARTIGSLRRAGVVDVIVLIGYMSERVSEWLDGLAGEGMRIRCVAVRRPENAFEELAEIRRRERGPLCFTDGGVFAEEGLVQCLAHNAEEEREAGLLVALAVNENPLYHLQATLDGSGRVRSFREVGIGDIKVSQQSPLPDMLAGVAVCGEGVCAVLEELANAERATLTEFARLCSDRNVFVKAVRTGLRYMDVEYPWEILGANYLARDLRFDGREPERRIPPSATVHSRAVLKGAVLLGEGVVVESGAVLEDVELGDETCIYENSYVARSVLGPKCSVGPLGYVRGAVLGPKCRVGTPGEFPVAVAFGGSGFGHHCHAGMSVFGEGSGLNAGAIATANREDAVKMRIEGRLIESGWKNLGSFIGDRCRINAGAVIMPGRKVGPHSVVGPGAIVYRDVPPRTRIVVRQQIEEQRIEEMRP